MQVDRVVVIRGQVIVYGHDDVFLLSCNHGYKANIEKELAILVISVSNVVLEHIFFQDSVITNSNCQKRIHNKSLCSSVSCSNT